MADNLNLHQFNPQWIKTYLIRYYQTFLQINEQVDYKNCNQTELLAIASETSSLHKIILDYIEEGHTRLTDLLIAQTDALNRLQHILNISLKQLGSKTEREYFYLYSEPVSLEFLKKTYFERGKTFALHEYLDWLNQQSEQPVDIEDCFENKQQMQSWMEKTKILVAETLEFLHWIIKRLQQQPTLVPVPLLRDTLLIYFGLTWCKHNGISIRSPQPLFMSRRFIKTLLGDQETTYLTLASEILYQTLCEQDLCDLTTLRREFAKRAHNHNGIAKLFTQTSLHYLASLKLEGPPCLLETGLNGTFPLWILALSNNTGDFLLYSTAPWLYTTYQNIVFTKNYNHLRDLETLVIHEHLIQFEKYADGQVIVRETCNEWVKKLALYELYVFKQCLKQKIPELT